VNKQKAGEYSTNAMIASMCGLGSASPMHATGGFIMKSMPCKTNTTPDHYEGILSTHLRSTV
jgi:hypothetical protein